ncbi:Contactin-associated protein-like 5 [Liparis tanakae]|uniref:Contactin-associated protein-like 5 n=1 Tax=Liparis tanakae TaxID=230148 RepID=A0A4Z2H956_9TELE|nr:Contactin-associated protein-like 5 [Liparis tanakae]
MDDGEQDSAEERARHLSLPLFLQLSLPLFLPPFHPPSLPSSLQSYLAGFDGRSSLLYRFNQKSMSTVKDVISLRFKSHQADGVLLHGEGQRGDYVTLELHRGALDLYLNLDDGRLRPGGSRVAVTVGSLLDDQQWHSVHVERFNKQVNLTVDAHTQHFHTKGEGHSLEVDYESLMDSSNQSWQSDEAVETLDLQLEIGPISATGDRQLEIDNWRLAPYRQLKISNWRLAPYRQLEIGNWRLAPYRQLEIGNWRLALYCQLEIRNWRLAPYRQLEIGNWRLALYCQLEIGNWRLALYRQLEISVQMFLKQLVSEPV